MPRWRLDGSLAPPSGHSDDFAETVGTGWRVRDSLRRLVSLAVSIALHLAIFLLLAAGLADRPEPPRGPLEVELLALPEPAVPAPPPAEDAVPQENAAAEEEREPVLLPERQIVRAPDAGEEKPPEETRFLSDRDTTVAEQSVQRGEPAAAEEVGEETEERRDAPEAEAAEEVVATEDPASARATDEPPEPAAETGVDRPERGPDIASLPDIEDLLPDAPRIAGSDFGRNLPERTARPPERRGGRGEELLRRGDVWQGRGRGGTLDYIPDVREGDITLLNTKAEQFAPFVRRVAHRVYANLIIFLRRELTGTGGSAREMVAVEAVMSPQGELISIRMRDRSGAPSLGTDRALRRAVREGFFDRNPPPGAESTDGNIHFLLRTELVVFGGPGGRRMGYQGVFSVGLM